MVAEGRAMSSSLDTVMVIDEGTGSAACTKAEASRMKRRGRMGGILGGNRNIFKTPSKKSCVAQPLSPPKPKEPASGNTIWPSRDGIRGSLDFRPEGRGTAWRARGKVPGKKQTLSACGVHRSYSL